MKKFKNENLENSTTKVYYIFIFKNAYFVKIEA